MAEGGQNTEKLQPEASSKVEKPWAALIRDNRAREAADRGVTPADASKGFLRRFTDRLFTDRPETIQLLLHGMFTSQAARLAVQDFMQGNYPSAAVEGVIAGALIVSPIRMINRIR